MKRRRLPKPVASATCVTGSVGVGQQLLGQQQALRRQPGQRRHAMALEDAPQVAVGHAQPRGQVGQRRLRRRARAWSSKRAAWSASTADESVSDSPGASSGRQRRQGRKPPLRPARALAKKRQFSRSGVRTRHTGRQ